MPDRVIPQITLFSPGINRPGGTHETPTSQVIYPDGERLTCTVGTRKYMVTPDAGFYIESYDSKGNPLWVSLNGIGKADYLATPAEIRGSVNQYPNANVLSTLFGGLAETFREETGGSIYLEFEKMQLRRYLGIRLHFLAQHTIDGEVGLLQLRDLSDLLFKALNTLCVEDGMMKHQICLDELAPSGTSFSETALFSALTRAQILGVESNPEPLYDDEVDRQLSQFSPNGILKSALLYPSNHPKLSFLTASFDESGVVTQTHLVLLENICSTKAEFDAYYLNGHR